jgi:hypothetical protein
VMNKWIGLCFSDGEVQLFILFYIRFIWSHLWSQLHLGVMNCGVSGTRGACAAEQGGVDNEALHNKTRDNEILYMEGGACFSIMRGTVL